MRAAAIAAMALVTALAANLLSPRRIPWVQDWRHYVENQAYREGFRLLHLEHMQQIVRERHALVFDARSLADYDRGHVPGALPFPESEKEVYAEQYAGLLTSAAGIVAYCSGGQCDESLELLRYLKRLGCTNLALYVGGWEEWKKATTN